ncbi:hypothetical protein ACQEVS_02305 [Streptomyces sp. CA-181903]|uniref:hypothetical protein n=1 Tax=Streptomyces sp. CA-181903 TaxID=3240055 RepID=UPI003D8F743B
MEAIWTSAVAVVGTLLGSVITHVLQRRVSERGESFARSEALRRERLTTYSAFAEAMEDYRHGQADRWYSGRDAPGTEEYVAARNEAHRRRTVARQALYRVRLLTDDPEVNAAAGRAYASTWEISTARDQSGRDALDARARQAIEEFVGTAAPLVR